jgi:aminopeptidase YwaD
MRQTLFIAAWFAALAPLVSASASAPPLLPSSQIAAASPIVLAEDSEAADVTAELVDVGEGSHESDYAGKDVRERIVLAAEQPGAVAELAVGKFGAAGIVSYAQNQKTAWSGDEDGLVRWGHLESFSTVKTFGFMVSLRAARSMQARLAHGETIRLHALVKAGQHPGFYEAVTGTIPGSDDLVLEYLKALKRIGVVE